MNKAPGTLAVPQNISVLNGRLAICKLPPDSETPGWVAASRFFSATRTPDELSVFCEEEQVPEDMACEKGWRALKLEGPLDFGLTGVLAGVAGPLAEAGSSIFAISTYDTDYVLIREDSLENATAALRKAGHEVQSDSIEVRRATVEDESFLWEMLYEAVHWSPEEAGPKPPPEELFSEFGLRRYLESWGRENDFAVVALNSGNGSRIGAAWYRTFPAGDPGYGFVDETIPEVVLAVVSDWRGAGVGGSLLRALMKAARSRVFEAISLAVRKSNPAAIKLYEKNGFVRLGEDGRAWIMRAELPADGTTNNL